MVGPEFKMWNKGELAFNVGQQQRLSLVVAGQTIELGDTGLRDLTGLLQNVTAGKLTLRRKGDLCVITASNIVVSSAANVIIVPASNIMASAAPLETQWSAPFPSSRIGIASSGAIYADAAAAGEAFSATLTFMSVATWWSDLRPLPGVADGQPTGV